MVPTAAKPLTFTPSSQRTPQTNLRTSCHNPDKLVTLENYPILKSLWRTLCYNPLQADDVWMVELGHDGGFSQEIPLLLLRVAGLEGLQRYWDVPLSRQSHASVTNLPKLP